MTKFFKDSESLLYNENKSPEQIIGTIANRYMSDNPATSFTYRAFSGEGFICDSDSRYIIDFDKKYSTAQNSCFAYAFSKLWSDVNKSCPLSVSTRSPVWIYINGKLVNSTSLDDEVFIPKKTIDIDLKVGWNSIFIKCQKNIMGFGCVVGSCNSKWMPLHFFAPFSENDGRLGWNYSGIYNHDIFESDLFPDVDASQKEQDILWYPETAQEPDGLFKLSTIFGNEVHGFAYGVTNFINPGVKKKFSVLGKSIETSSIYIDGKLLGTVTGEYQFHTELKSGEHYIVVMASHQGDNDWGFTLEMFCDGEKCEFTNPLRVKGTKSKWLYVGILQDSSNDIIYRFDSSELYQTNQGKTYWRVDDTNTYIRPVLENEIFGKWSYPVGVVMYGMLQTARHLHNKAMMEYVQSHILMCAKMQEYALWDKEKFGHACINQQIQEIDALDDCGSFGSAMLEFYKENPDEDARRVADTIANYIENKQERMENGAFYRKMQGHPFNNTMWADDLYMSVPFLCRYYQMSGDRKYIDDAAKQFLAFKEYLYLEEEGLFSHVYNFNYDKATEIPWGRGNGWVLFSLSELLEVLPEDHELRGILIALFIMLCENIIKYQDHEGRWHQVLTDNESYAETSCTSMFIYALCRGVRFGWLKNSEIIDKIMLGWHNMIKSTVDKYGNIYGVCVGSGYSFRKDYYKKELQWNKNDTHGTGIVLLATIEVIKLIEWLKRF